MKRIRENGARSVCIIERLALGVGYRGRIKRNTDQSSNLRDSFLIYVDLTLYPKNISPGENKGR